LRKYNDNNDGHEPFYEEERMLQDGLLYYVFLNFPPSQLYRAPAFPRTPENSPERLEFHIGDSLGNSSAQSFTYVEFKAASAIAAGAG